MNYSSLTLEHLREIAKYFAERQIDLPSFAGRSAFRVLCVEEGGIVFQTGSDGEWTATNANCEQFLKIFAAQSRPDARGVRFSGVPYGKKAAGTYLPSMLWNASNIGLIP